VKAITQAQLETAFQVAQHGHQEMLRDAVVIVRRVILAGEAGLAERAPEWMLAWGGRRAVSVSGPTFATLAPIVSAGELESIVQGTYRDAEERGIAERELATRLRKSDGAFVF
jgi:hypothetical protein